jgi:hypothetical protein
MLVVSGDDRNIAHKREPERLDRPFAAIGRQKYRGCCWLRLVGRVKEVIAVSSAQTVMANNGRCPSRGE